MVKTAHCKKPEIFFNSVSAWAFAKRFFTQTVLFSLSKSEYTAFVPTISFRIFSDMLLICKILTPGHRLVEGVVRVNRRLLAFSLHYLRDNIFGCCIS